MALMGKGGCYTEETVSRAVPVLVFAFCSGVCESVCGRRGIAGHEKPDRLRSGVGEEET